MRIVRARTHRYELPFSRPVVTSRGRFASRRGFLVELRDHRGRTGWGDAAPWPGFNSPGDDDVRQALSDLTAQGGPLLGRTFEHVDEIEAWLQPRAGSRPAEVLHAVELALLDLLGQEQRQPVARLLGPARGPRVAVSAVVDDPTSAANAVSAGIRTLKIKVGHEDLEADAQRLTAIRAAVGDAVRLRADANGAWSLQTARRAIERLGHLDLQWLEQPVAAPRWDDLQRLRGHGIPIAADEALALAAGTSSLPCADVYVLKPMFIGGLLAARTLARRVSGQVVVSCAWESGIGRAGALHLAAALDPTCAAGLASPLRRDLTAGAHPMAEAGALPVPAGPGLGAAPHSDAALEAL